MLRNIRSYAGNKCWNFLSLTYTFFNEKIHERRYSKFIKKGCKIGKNVIIKESELDQEVNIARHAEITYSNIGRLTSIGKFTKIDHADIGSFCAISWDSTIGARGHPINHLTVSAFPYVPHLGGFVKMRDQNFEYITLKNDIWVGANSVLMPGITIGNGAVIGAGSVVTKNVPDYAIVAGVPAKVINYRFKEDVINELLKIKWWNLDKNTIKDNIHLFQGDFDSNKLRELKKVSYNNNEL